MKIRFIETLSTPQECYQQGDEYDLEAVQAQSYIDSGVAVLVTETASRRINGLLGFPTPPQA